MNSDKSVWNESTIDLMGNLFESIDICGHPLRNQSKHFIVFQFN